MASLSFECRANAQIKFIHERVVFADGLFAPGKPGQIKVKLMA